MPDVNQPLTFKEERIGEMFRTKVRFGPGNQEQALAVLGEEVEMAKAEFPRNARLGRALSRALDMVAVGGELVFRPESEGSWTAEITRDTAYWQGFGDTPLEALVALLGKLEAEL